MGNHTAKWLIIVSTLALITLTLFQINWLKQSRELIEKQFDQKVTMALCQSIDQTCMPPTASDSSSPMAFSEMLNDQNFNNCVRTNFDKYDVDLDYEMSVLPCKPAKDQKQPVYGCSLQTSGEDSAQFLAVQFDDKSCYVAGKMKFMSWSSFFILAFIGGIFVWANYLIWKQKKLNQSNIDFFNHMAHELRTPLTSISLATNMLAKENKSISSSKYFYLINRENKQLRDQVDMLMLSAQLDQAEKHIEKEWVSVNNLIQSLQQEYGLALDQIGAQLTISDYDQSLRVWGNQFHLTQAFKNLMDNAIKYRKDNLHIHIEVDASPNGVEIQFKDNGMGIHAKDHPHIFEKYHRAENSRSKAGFGLGLSYVKSVAEIHNGFIRFISNLNQGSQFNFFIPNSK